MATASPTVSLTMNLPVSGVQLGSSFDRGAKQRKINDLIASQCPLTYACLSKSNDLSLQLIEENTGMNLKQLLVHAVGFSLIFVGSMYVSAYLDNVSPSQPFPIYAALDDGTEVLKRLPTFAQRIPSMAENFLEKQLSAQTCPQNGLSGMKDLDPSLSMIVSGIAGGVFSLGTAINAGKMVNRKALGDFANELKVSLPAISEELTQAGMDSNEISSIRAVFNGEIRSLESISKSGIQKAWPKALVSASLAAGAAGIYFGIKNLATFGALATIWSGGVDFFKNGVFPKSTGDEKAQIRLQDRVQQYLE